MDTAVSGTPRWNRFCHANNSDANDYLQACFARAMEVTEVVVQKGHSYQWITGARVQYQSLTEYVAEDVNATSWTDVDEGANFELEYGAGCLSVIYLTTPIQAMCVRVIPTSQSQWKAFHLGFKGYSASGL